jgi:hypothetical protein
LGFDWYPHETTWEANLGRLKAFKERFGACDIRRGRSSRTLAAWIFELRHRGKQAISKPRRRALDALGFEWTSLRVKSWEKHFSELTAFKQKFGHCNVPASQGSELGEWVSKQRNRRARLSPERKRRLTKLGFVWRINSMSARKTWDERFRELIAFRQRFGNCDVPTGWPENKPLAEWVRRQRARDRVKLTAAQTKKLNGLGFSWNRRESTWEKRFSELAAFKKAHGHCDVVPEDSPQLAVWVFNQRYNRKLSATRTAKLSSLGFRFRRESSNSK